MNIFVSGANEASKDFWELSGVLGHEKWKHTPFIVLSERPESVLIQEQIAELDGQIRICAIYTDPNGGWATSKYEHEKATYAKHVEESKQLKRERAALEKKLGGKDMIFQVTIAEDLQGALTFSDDCVVLKQWQGRWRSDFFKTTVGELRRRSEKHTLNDWHRY